MDILDCKGEMRPRGCWHIAQSPERFACQNRHGWFVWSCQSLEIVPSPSYFITIRWLPNFNLFTWFLMKIFQIQNIKVSCRRKTKYGDVAQIWRQRNFNFTLPRLKRLNNCFENSNFFIHITIWLKSFSDSEERWHWNLKFGVFGDKMAFYKWQH